jgi:alpha-L-rhamnosidase
VPVRLLRKEIELRAKPVSARLYATALGLYEVSLNGGRVGDELLTPGWTSYRKRLAYQTWDVTARLRAGRNAVAAMLGTGWYKGDLTWLNARNVYGRETALSLELRVRYADGAEDTFMTDQSWKCSTGPILESELYHGETYDGRLELPGWDLAGYDDAAWQPVRKVDFDPARVVAQDGPAVRVQERIAPVALIVTPKGERVLDFGQNLTGWVAFTVRGGRGERVVLSHAEVLDAEGNFYTANMRSARNRIEYVLSGTGEERYRPRFTFQGFRYVRVDEWPGERGPAAARAEDFEAGVIHSDMERTLDFECSHDLLNRLHRNILWGWKGNAVDVPTDCPQRDERLGWTGDAEVFVGTAAWLMDVDVFFRKWLRDLAADQLADGGVPFVIPDVLTAIAHLDPNFKGSDSSTGWGDAAVIVPWTLYRRYGDERLLAEQYPSMKAWVEKIRASAEDGLIWNTGFHFGDWVALDAKEGSYFGATPNDLTATAFYAYSTGLLAEAAAVLGAADDAAEYRKLRADIVDAFRAEFVTGRGRIASRTQTAHILALVFGLLEERDRPRATRDLASLIEENGGHLTTGFLGTPFILRALAENGRLDLAYELLLKTDYPSWLYQITKGATTVWEHWDGLKPDGTMWSENMNSFNHYAYGAVGQWMYETVGGLAPDPAVSGFKSFIVAPRPGGGIDRCGIAYRGPYGELRSSWKVEGNRFALEVKVPPNSAATVVLPDGSERRVGSGTHRFNSVLKLGESAGRG